MQNAGTSTSGATRPRLPSSACTASVGYGGRFGARRAAGRPLHVLAPDLLGHGRLRLGAAVGDRRHLDAVVAATGSSASSGWATASAAAWSAELAARAGARRTARPARPGAARPPATSPPTWGAGVRGSSFDSVRGGRRAALRDRRSAGAARARDRVRPAPSRAGAGRPAPHCYSRPRW